MKQILQNMGTGETSIIEAPMPQNQRGHLLISATTSLISVGTERMLVDFGKASFIEKARKQPDKVKMVLDKVKTDGLFSTIDAVKSKLAQPLPLGYCHVGKVCSVAEDIKGFSVGDRVVSNGSHADIVRVPKHLCAKIPPNVDDESAAFTVLASIGLQGIRLAKPTLGESFVVIGAGLIGLLTIQLLIANGCRVLAIDFDEKKLKLAQGFGADICNPSKGQDPVDFGVSFSRSAGVDAVIITASTSSNEPVSQAANMCRKRGRIILVGVTGLELNRSEFYEKELKFQVSCSYGPGRYDQDYENKGNDYPIGFVRWTEQRNFTAILDMMASGKLNVKPLISHQFDFSDALSAYDTLTNHKDALGILLNYPGAVSERINQEVILSEFNQEHNGSPVIGFIGAGNYASRVLIPAFKKANSSIHTIATSSGINGVIHGAGNDVHKTTTDTQALFDNETINTVAIVTQHNSHAHFVCTALKHNKNVFVEKPLAINHEQLEQVINAYNGQESMSAKHLMVGFNRRFSPQVIKIKSLLSSSHKPKSLIMTMNAGAIPKEHWTQDKETGGGRIIGEACHFIDLMRYLVGHKIKTVHAVCNQDSNTDTIIEDVTIITLTFQDGSIGSIHYFANGSSSFPKERVEVFDNGKVLQLDNFRKLSAFGYKNFKKMNLWQQDKGQEACAKAFLKAIEENTPCPIPIDEIFEVARITIDAANQLSKKHAISHD